MSCRPCRQHLTETCGPHLCDWSEMAAWCGFVPLRSDGSCCSTYFSVPCAHPPTPPPTPPRGRPRTSLQSVIKTRTCPSQHTEEPADLLQALPLCGHWLFCWGGPGVRCVCRSVTCGPVCRFPQPPPRSGVRAGSCRPFVASPHPPAPETAAPL